MQDKRLIIILLLIAMVLLIPLVAMQFTDEVNWSLFDFIAAGVLLLGTGLVFEIVMRKVPKRSHRIAICLVLIMLLVLVWAELAIGVFGTAIAGS
jgi:bacteriorhodopsin